MHVHNLQGVDPQFNYELEVSARSPITNATGGREIKEHKERSEKRKPPMQFAKPFYLPIPGLLLQTELSITLVRHNTTFGKRIIGRFACKFENALDLLAPGNPHLTVQFDKFVYEPDYLAKTKDAKLGPQPQLVATLAYHNSLFTQMSQGELAIKVISWHFNGSAFPSNYYVQFKIGSSGSQVSCKKLYNALTFKVNQSAENVLDTLAITVSEDRAMARDPTLTSTQIKIYELFNTNDSTSTGNIVYQSAIHTLTLNDLEN